MVRGLNIALLFQTATKGLRVILKRDRPRKPEDLCPAWFLPADIPAAHPRPPFRPDFLPRRWIFMKDVNNASGIIFPSSARRLRHFPFPGSSNHFRSLRSARIVRAFRAASVLRAVAESLETTTLPPPLPRCAFDARQTRHYSRARIHVGIKRSSELDPSEREREREKEREREREREEGERKRTLRRIKSGGRLARRIRALGECSLRGLKSSRGGGREGGRRRSFTYRRGKEGPSSLSLLFGHFTAVFVPARASALPASTLPAFVVFSGEAATSNQRNASTDTPLPTPRPHRRAPHQHCVRRCAYRYTNTDAGTTVARAHTPGPKASITPEREGQGRSNAGAMAISCKGIDRRPTEGSHCSSNRAILSFMLLLAAQCLFLQSFISLQRWSVHLTLKRWVVRNFRILPWPGPHAEEFAGSSAADLLERMADNRPERKRRFLVVWKECHAFRSETRVSNVQPICETWGGLVRVCFLVQAWDFRMAWVISPKSWPDTASWRGDTWSFRFHGKLDSWNWTSSPQLCELWSRLIFLRWKVAFIVLMESSLIRCCAEEIRCF